MMPNTNIKVVYDFYNQQPESNGDKLNALASKNAIQRNDYAKAKRPTVNTVNNKRSVLSSLNPIKIEGEIQDEESERDNRFARPITTKKASNTPNKPNTSSVSKGKTSGITAGKSVTKQPVTKSKSPIRSISPISKKIVTKELKPSKSPTPKPKILDTPINERPSESNSINKEDLKSSRNVIAKDSTSSKQIPIRSETPNSRPSRLSNSQTKLNGSFANVADTSKTRPKTPIPAISKNNKINPLKKLSSNNLSIVSARGDNDENNLENVKENKNTKSTNPSIYTAHIKNVSKNVPVKMNLLTKKNVIEGTFADGDDLESSANSPNKSKIDQAKEQNMFSKNVNIFQLAKDEKDSKTIKLNNLKKLNIQDPGEMNNSYNLINKKKIDFKFISTSPIIRKKDYDNLKKINLKSDENKNANSNTPKGFGRRASIDNQVIIKEENKNVNPDTSQKKIIKSIFEFSKVGYSGSSKKVNQDIYFVYKNLGGNVNHIFLGVCDGHGEIGHEVSGYLRENLPFLLNRRLKILNKNIITDNVNSIISDTFLDINNKFHKSQIIDTSFSGSTCCSMIFTPEKILTANVGDSRAVIGKQVEGAWQSLNITRDHKPTEKDEAQRIKKHGGRILPFRDEDTNEFVGPARVWIKEEDIPGLAMTRSFGDQVASTVGVMAEPEIFEHKLTEEDKFLIVASDGVWEFIESDECVEIIKDFYLNNDGVGCCEYLYKESCKRWMKEEEVIDDITMVLMFFE